MSLTTASARTYAVPARVDTPAGRAGPVPFPPDLGLDLLTGLVLVDAAGVPIMVDGATAWRQWNILTAQTQKAAFYAFPRDFGVDVKGALAARDPATQLTIFCDGVRRALVRDARNAFVSVTVTQQLDEYATVAIRCTSAQGETHDFTTELANGT